LSLSKLVPGLKLGKVIEHMISPPGFIMGHQHLGIEIAVALPDQIRLVPGLHIDVIEVLGLYSVAHMIIL